MGLIYFFIATSIVALGIGVWAYLDDRKTRHRHA